MSEAATKAIVSHVMRSLDRGSPELRVALLTRDAADEIAREITRRFVTEFAKRLRERDPGMEQLLDELSSDPFEKWACLSWRHKSWPRGACICLQFEGQLKGAFGGFSAQSRSDLETNLRDSPEEYKSYESMDDDTLDRINVAVSERSATFQGERDEEWPVCRYLQAPLNDWKTTDALLILAGVEDFQGRPFLDWLVDEFVLIREAVRPIL